MWILVLLLIIIMIVKSLYEPIKELTDSEKKYASKIKGILESYKNEYFEDKDYEVSFDSYYIEIGKIRIAYLDRKTLMHICLNGICIKDKNILEYIFPYVKEYTKEIKEEEHIRRQIRHEEAIVKIYKERVKFP